MLLDGAKNKYYSTQVKDVSIYDIWNSTLTQFSASIPSEEANFWDLKILPGPQIPVSSVLTKTGIIKAHLASLQLLLYTLENKRLI